MKQICAFFAVLLISTVAQAGYQGSTSFTYKLSFVEPPPPPPPRSCAFAAPEWIEELSQPSYSTAPDIALYTEISYPGFNFTMRIPPTVTKVVLGVGYSDHTVLEYLSLPNHRFTDEDGNEGHLMRPFFWHYLNDPSEHFEIDTQASSDAVTLKSGWATDKAINVVIPPLRVKPDKPLSVTKYDPAKTWTSKPVFLTCYDDSL